MHVSDEKILTNIIAYLLVNKIYLPEDILAELAAKEQHEAQYGGSKLNTLIGSYLLEAGHYDHL